MAEIQSPGYKNPQQNGEYGNARVAHFAVTLAALATTDLVLLGQLPGGSKITRVSLKAADLGTGNTLDIGYRYQRAADGAAALDGFFNNLDTSAAALANSMVLGPINIANGQGVDVTLSTAGAVATGQVDLFVEYVWNGQ
jgi:hypothetical protein